MSVRMGFKAQAARDMVLIASSNHCRVVLDSGHVRIKKDPLNNVGDAMALGIKTRLLLNESTTVEPERRRNLSICRHATSPYRCQSKQLLAAPEDGNQILQFSSF
jgi:hypothetical protein